MMIEIKSYRTGEVLYSGEHADLNGANLASAYLAGADLAGADLAGAYLYGASLARAYLTRANLASAYLASANLPRANLTRANLAGANLAGADLARANLAGADLARAYLAGADLARAYLTRANLAGANLTRANLAGANLTRANLAGAYLASANLAGANLAGAYLPTYQICPETGAFRAWKKLKRSIAELGVPGDASRTSSLVGRKCRASKVKVLRLIPLPGSTEMASDVGRHDGTVYTVGEYTTPDSFDPDPRIECTHGIHFFVTRAEAEAY